MPALIAYVDAQQRYTFVNAHYERLFGADAAGIVGRAVREARGEAAYQVSAPHVAAALRGEVQIFEREADATTANRYLQSHFIPDSGPDGAVPGFYAPGLASLPLLRTSLLVVVNRLVGSDE